MRPLTFSSNKHLIPIANKPLIFYALESLAEAGIKEIGINYNPGQFEELKVSLGNGKKWGVKLTYILQPQPLGLADVIKVSREFLGKDKFVMYLGDNIFFGGIKPLVDYFKKSKATALLALVHHPENRRLGVPYFNRQGKLIKLVEKPPKPPHDWAISGLYFASEEIFKCFSGKKAIKPSARGEYEITSPFQWLIKEGYEVETREFKGVWLDPGKFEDWLETNRFILDQNTKNGIKSKLGKGVKIEGRVQIDSGCRIEKSLLRGPVTIGKKVIIRDSFIGPYSSIYDHCQIIGARIENSILLKSVKIFSPSKIIDSSLIGQETEIQGNHHQNGALELFVGNQCEIKL